MSFPCVLSGGWSPAPSSTVREARGQVASPLKDAVRPGVDDPASVGTSPSHTTCPRSTLPPGLFLSRKYFSCNNLNTVIYKLYKCIEGKKYTLFLFPNAISLGIFIGHVPRWRVSYLGRAPARSLSRPVFSQAPGADTSHTRRPARTTRSFVSRARTREGHCPVARCASCVFMPRGGRR